MFSNSDTSFAATLPEIMSAGPGEKQITIVPTWAIVVHPGQLLFCDWLKYGRSI